MPQPNGEPINLIIAVSFGLFVPSRLINASKYGGLNVHPSLLPDLRGPAPIHHALLAERDYTGITIQTLSPEAFDAGIPLLQTPAPGVPIPEGCTPEQLHEILAPMGAQLLVQALRAGLYVPPYRPYDPLPSERQQQQQQQQKHLQQQQEKKKEEKERQEDNGQERTTTPHAFPPPPPPPTHAPKITPQDRQVLWTSQAAREVAVRHRVLGSLWTHVRIGSRGKGAGRRKGKGRDDGAGEEEGGGGAGGKGSASEKRAILEDLSVVPGPPGRAAARAGAAVDVDAAPAPARENSDGDGTVVWVEKTPLSRTKEEQRKNGGTVGTESKCVTLPYWVDADGEGVVVRMSNGSWLRIGRIKVEGSTSKPARLVLGAR
ncbi:uncharacterized protein P884DRAFT_284665 [Thermothelomyces heterothallicus CBS 202.75]|uniref:uncharacterized protein n=1 Tax=Thermothelomyces heterothallicus CBS 202.75 TaxID=1149848 RepID=UPI003742937B